MFCLSKGPQSALLKIRGKLTKFIKKWLNLPRCCTTAVVYHPDVLKLPYLPQIREQAKMSMLSSLEFSSDPAIKECLSLIKDPDFLRWLDMPSNSLTFLKAAQDSTSSLSTAAVKQSAKFYLNKSHSEAWTASLDPLEVQSKFKDIISLEPQSHTWNCLWLDYRQASFPFYSELDRTVCPLH